MCNGHSLDTFDGEISVCIDSVQAANLKIDDEQQELVRAVIYTARLQIGERKTAQIWHRRHTRTRFIDGSGA